MKTFKGLFSKDKKTKETPLSESETVKDRPGVSRINCHSKATNMLPQEVVGELKASKAREELPGQATQPPTSSSRSKFVDMKTGSDFKPQNSAQSKQKSIEQADEKMPVKQAVEFAEVKDDLQNSGCADGFPAPASDDFVESPMTTRAYAAVPILEQTKLPRGGVSVDTKAVGRVQYGIPPETIKDSMKLGIPVPQVYIVPTERFSREMGPALGVNLAEFEFPAYFNYFVYKKKCTLVVDSGDAEENIRKVFSETLLGPEQFRRENSISYEEEDFAPDYPRDAIPDFHKELKHFRIMPDGHELVIETLLDFRHYEFVEAAESLGVPKPIPGDEESKVEDVKINEVSDEEQVHTAPSDLREVLKRENQGPWTYSEATSNGDVSRVYPFSATPEDIAAGKVPRVEIFKMPGGTEYIIHDIDENNQIIGKAKLSGHVKVSEYMSVDGFGGRSFLDAMNPSKGETQIVSPDRPLKAPSFHPPSFGVTVLGNSHGFDKSGSVSGYVLWVNGRGIMIDPPPYSSATLEREGIRPRTIVGIILTHCHADHDAGAFQKVLTGSPVVVITTPTIYKSFIRKYSALSALSPALLRHSHRYKPAIIGEPLRFQGATFHFIYTLHAIPCVGFRVEWRGRSMVFTGDHFNNPAGLEKLVEKGVMSKARMDDLNHLPLQDCDLLLHESGAPPIHTPLEVLLQLPKHVKERLYVVHTSALPDDCELRVAPTGTAGTIRLDKSSSHDRKGSLLGDENMWSGPSSEYSTIAEESETDLDQSLGTSNLHSVTSARGGRGKATQRTSVFSSGGRAPLVSLRPASSTDAWYILNLLSAVPFLSSLSYTQTMEVLEIARVDAYSVNDVVVSASKRSSVLCVIWEGTCTELPAKRPTGSSTTTISEDYSECNMGSGPFWHAGDWTGPRALQPEEALSGESPTSTSHDIVAVSNEGVKVIKIDFPSLHAILNCGSQLYRRFLDRNAGQERAKMDATFDDEFASATDLLLETAKKELNVLELLNCNSALRKLTAVQKRHLESLAVGPISYQQGERLWGAGTPVDKAFIIVSGTASFVKRRNASTTEGSGFSMKMDMETAIKELGGKHHGDENSSMSSVDHDEQNPKVGVDAMSNADYKKLQKNLQSRAEFFQKEGSVSSGLSGYSGDSVSHDGDYDSDENIDDSNHRRNSTMRRRSSRMRQANKVLGRLYNRRAFTAGLVFSKGHFLGDVSKMVAGLLSSDAFAESDSGDYGFGEKDENSTAADNALATITEASGAEGGYHVLHNSTLTAGKDGCVVLLFHKASLIPFLDEHPGLLLSLLGTQVVV